MEMRRVFAAVVVPIVAIALLLSACGQSEPDQSAQPAQPNDDQMVKLGITQIVEHPALDQVRKGIVDALAANGYQEGKGLSIDWKSAQGSFDTAMSIAQKYVGDKQDMIVAISTPSAQAAVQATSQEGKQIPVVFAAVTDPLAAGLVSSAEKPGGHVTGTSDQVPMDKQVELIKKFIPDIKKLGVIYNSGEVNAGVQVDMIAQITNSMGIEMVKAGITNGSEVQQGTQSLVGKVDAILIPIDNTVVSAFEGVLAVAQEAGIPVFASDSDTVKRGAVATYGIDYYKMGYQTGEMAARILKGKDPGSLPVEVSKEVALVVNKKALEAFGLDLSEELKAEAAEIIE